MSAISTFVLRPPSWASCSLSAPTSTPDAILLDLLMPGTSGWDTAAALKCHPETMPSRS